jgi:hypothetical protein
MTDDEQRPTLAAELWHRQLAAARSGGWAALRTILAPARPLRPKTSSDSPSKLAVPAKLAESPG